MRATAGATGTKRAQLAPKEIGDCSALDWSGLGLVGKHSRTEHGQVTRGRPAYPGRRAERSTSGPPDGVLAKDRHCVDVYPPPQPSWQRPRLGQRSLSTGMSRHGPGGPPTQGVPRTTHGGGQVDPMDRHPKSRRRGVGIEYCVPECPIAVILENFRRYAARVRPTLRLNRRRKKVGSS